MAYRLFYTNFRQLVLFFLSYFGFPLNNWVQTNVSDSYTQHIRFNLYYGPDARDYMVIPFEDGITFNKYKFFNDTYQTIFYFPGWGELAKDIPDRKMELSVQTLAEAFRTMADTNLVVIDYVEVLNTRSWIDAMYNCSMIGHALSQYMEHYIPVVQTRDKLHFIGHSLGAPIISYVARFYKQNGHQRFSRLTGLDPASGFFGTEDYLRKGDGDFVDIVHTGDGSGGLPYGYGDIDFLPNGGANQPYCKLDMSVFYCYHAMSWTYYAESVNEPVNFKGKRCTSDCQSYFPNCICNSSDIAYLGVRQDTSKSGMYFMKTNNKPLFGLGDKGLNFGVEYVKAINQKEYKNRSFEE